MGYGDPLMGIHATFNDLGTSDTVAKSVETALGCLPYKVLDWYELNKELFVNHGDRRP